MPVLRALCGLPSTYCYRYCTGIKGALRSAKLDAPALRAAAGIATGGKYCNIRCHALRAATGIATGIAGLAAARLLARVLAGIGATLDRERNRETEREGDRDR